MASGVRCIAEPGRAQELLLGRLVRVLGCGVFGRNKDLELRQKFGEGQPELKNPAPEFDRIQPPLPTLALRDGALGPAQPLSNFHLGYPSLLPHRAEQLEEQLVLFAEL